MKKSRCQRGAVLGVVIFLIVVLVGVTAVAWPTFRGYREEVDALKKDLAGARQEVRALAQRPTVDELNDVRASLADAKGTLGNAEAALAEKTEALNAAVAKAKGLQAKLHDEQEDVEGFAGELASARKRIEELAAAKEDLEAQLITTAESYENARRAASGKEDLLDKLDAAARKSAALEKRLAAAAKALAEKDQALDAVKANYRQATDELSKRDELLSKLRTELAEIPLMPLPDELAKQKYHEYLNMVAEHTDRESRVTTLFRAKIALAGSSYEDKADAAWRREQKRKQDDVDRASRVVYDDVNTKIRLHPDAHDDNVRLLQDAMEKILGSRYEKVLQQLIDREHELKAAGR